MLVLVLTGETPTRLLHPQDRAVVPLFGDAGTATLLERVPEGQGFVQFELGTDGSGHEHLILPTSGLRHPRTPESAQETKKFGIGRVVAEKLLEAYDLLEGERKPVGARGNRPHSRRLGVRTAGVALAAP